jgi:putative hydrolase of the HAD superfamily
MPPTNVSIAIYMQRTIKNLRYRFVISLVIEAGNHGWYTLMRLLAMIKALLFDFGGTLDGPAHWLDRFLAQYHAAGIEISRAQLDPGFDHATKTAYGATRIVARFRLTDLIRFLVGHQLEFLRANGPPSIRTMIEDAGGPGRHRIVEKITASFVSETKAGMNESRRAIEGLRNKFKMGVVSNFYGNLGTILDEAGFEKYFAAIADSSQLKIFKPDPGIFQAALKSLKLKPEEAAMIGDSLDKDCAPARHLGMRTVWYQAHPNGISDREGVADFTIMSLEGLYKVAW